MSVFLEHNLVLALVLATALAGAVGAGWKLASLWTGWTSGMQAVIVSAPSR